MIVVNISDKQKRRETPGFWHLVWHAGNVRRLTVLILATVLILVTGIAVWAKSPGPVETVVEFDGSALELPESLAFDKRGNAYISFALTGEIRQVAPDGTQAAFAALDRGEDGFLLGLKVAPDGDVYVALASFNEETHGVWLISPDGSSQRLAALPLTVLPNDVALDPQGSLYVTDSLGGAVWRIPRQGEPEIWIQHELLVGQSHPSIPFPIGANGLAFGKNGALYVANTTFSRIVRIPVNRGGTAAEPEIFVEDEQLGGADGIAFDAQGNLYTTNALGGGIFRINLDGDIETLATADEIDDPSSVAFGTRGGEQQDLFITNFAFFTQKNPALLKMHIGIPGKPLP